MYQNLFKMMATQVVVCVFFALIIGFRVSEWAAWSTLLGGAAAFIPNSVFGLYYFSDWRASRAKMLVRRFYRAEAFKILSTALLVALSVRYTQIDVKWFLFGFLFLQLSAWLTPVFFKGPVWRML
jgi:ATP synthase protein I